jgi:hypothetical protein
MDGQLKALRRSNNIIRAIASSELTTDTGADFAELLRTVTEETNSVLVPGLFNGDDDGEAFNLVTERELSDLTGKPIGSPEFSNILAINGERYAARLKRTIQPSCWMLLDFDRNVPGMPNEWRGLPIEEAAALCEPMLAGINEASAVIYRSSSARVHGPGRPLGEPSHMWLKVREPHLIEHTMRALQIRSVLNGLAFRSPRYSQTTGEIIGNQWRSIFDWSVLITGRLVYTSKPILTEAAQHAGYQVAEAGVQIRRGTDFSLSGVVGITPEEMIEYQRITGMHIEYRGGSVNPTSVHVSGILNYNTPITVRGSEAPLGGWLENMREGETLRCEAPFRESTSEAAFIRCTGTMRCIVHDIGVGETYTLADETVQARTTQEAANLGARLLERLPERTQQQLNRQAQAEIAQNEADAELPLVMVDKEQPEVAARQIMPHLRNIQHHPLWSVGGYMVFVDGAKLINVDRSDPRHMMPVLGTVKMNPAHMLEMIPQVVSLKQYRGRNLIGCKPSTDIISILLNSPDMKDHLPLLRAVSGTPFMRPDGSICQEQGYDPETGTWLQTPLDIDVPEVPSRAEAEASLEQLRGLLTEMHFAEVPEDGSVGIDESVALAAMMGVVLRPSFEACPAVIINGTAAGAGKSYFTKLLGVLATGKDPAMLSWPKRAEELDKLLDSLLFGGVSMIAFDNANGVKIGGQKICSIVSESVIAGRLLGATQDIKLSTRGTSLIINGNRVEAREDFAARAMTMQLAPNVVQARSFQFQGSPLNEVRQNRAVFVRDILTIARWYRANAENAGTRLPVWQGFAEWSNTIRSALAALGCADPVRSIEEAVAADDDLAGVTAIVRAAAGWRGDGAPWKVSEFVAYLTAQPQITSELREVLDPDDTHGVARFSSLLGYWLRDKVAGRTVELPGGRLALVEKVRGAGATHGGSQRWRVVSL